MIKLTVKQETFAQQVALGKSQAEAYRLAYNAEKMLPATVDSKASVLGKQDKITARVAELRAPAIAAVGLTLEGHLTRLQWLSKKAEKKGQMMAAITAEVNRGKAAGLYVEKREITGKDGEPLQTAIASVVIYVPDNGRD